MSEQKRCCERVYGPGRWSIGHQCTSKAKIEHDGRHYCGRHDPQAKAKKEAERMKEIQDKYAAANRERRAAADRQAQLEKDAERYRFLRDAETLNQVIWDALEGIGSDTPEGYRRGMDDAIDRAISAKQADKP